MKLQQIKVKKNTEGCNLGKAGVCPPIPKGLAEGLYRRSLVVLDLEDGV
jgi:hypothetical protein